MGQQVIHRPTGQQPGSQPTQQHRQEDVVVRRPVGPPRRSGSRIVAWVATVLLAAAAVLYVVNASSPRRAELVGQAQEQADLQAEKQAILANRGEAVRTTTEGSGAIVAHKANALARSGQSGGTVVAGSTAADKANALAMSFATRRPAQSGAEAATAANALARDTRTMNAIVDAWESHKLIGQGVIPDAPFDRSAEFLAKLVGRGPVPDLPTDAEQLVTEKLIAQGLLPANS